MFKQQGIKIIVLLLVGSGVIFGYSNYSQSPEKIVQKMSERVTEIKSLEYSGEIKTEVDMGNGQPASNTSIKFNGVSDTHDLNNPEGTFSFDINTDALGQGTSAFGLEIKTINKVVYIKLGKVPNLGFFDLSKFANQWIKIETQTLKQQLGLEKLEAQTEEQKNQELSLEQIRKLKTAFQQAEIFRITDSLPNETVDGVNTYHYKFIIDKEELKNFIVDVSPIFSKKTLTEEELADLDKSLATIDMSEGEIWIGTSDLLPYKISLESTVKEMGEQKNSGEIDISLMFKNFNKPVQIEVPTPVKTFEEILGGLFGGSMMGLPSNIKLPTR